VTKSTALRFATADDFATIPLPSHTLRAAWANLQAELPVSKEGCGEEHHVLHRVPRFTISMSETEKIFSPVRRQIAF